jgi:predicted molibdopterin-dependent oxidoreductase YjgC
VPDGEYPFRYTTGRTAYHFHTRTKTGRTPQLNDAAPEAWVEISVNDASTQGLQEGDMVRVESRRGHLTAALRVGDIRDGTLFVPFHYGYWDKPGDLANGHRAANELTITEWDPVSKQPVLKNAACRIRKVAEGTGPSLAPTTTASRPADAKPASNPADSGKPGRAEPRGTENRGNRRSRIILPTVGGAAAQATEVIAPVEPPAVATKEERA